MSYLNQELTRSSAVHIEPNEILESPSSLKERTGSTPNLRASRDLFGGFH
jgi:hypothetical protein